MDLLEIEKIDFKNNTLVAVFDGMFKGGFRVETEFDYDKEQIEVEDNRTGCKDYYEATAISFWFFKLIDSEDKEFTVSERETKRIKQLVEFQLIDLLEIEINNL